MDLYDQVKKQWQMWSVCSGEDLDLRLDNFRILFAYNSGKIENAAISYHDTREIFENGRVVGYTGDPRTLFELQNQKVCYDFLREKIPVKEPLSEVLPKSWTKVMRQSHFEFCIGQDLTHSIFL